MFTSEGAAWWLGVWSGVALSKPEFDSPSCFYFCGMKFNFTMTDGPHLSGLVRLTTGPCVVKCNIVK